MKNDMRGKVLKHLRRLADYWATHTATPREAAIGMTFSILVMLDGESSLPAFAVRPLVDGREGPDIIGERMLHEEWAAPEAEP